MLERRRRYLIIRVDRADLSKNVLRGFTAFDTFLTQHPEFREQVTFIAHLQPSRQDVPEYAEYRERIEALVAVVNHRHGTTDWMPIDLRIYENFADAVARYKHYDLLMVNAIFDGMNLVAKEAPAVNTRDGVLMLSENTGSHQELEDWVITVNPFDIQEQSDAIYRALTMEPEKRAAGPGPAGHHLRPRSRRLGRRPARRHRKSPRRADFLLAARGERTGAPCPWVAVAGVLRIRSGAGSRGWRRAWTADRRRRPGGAAAGRAAGGPTLLRAPEPPPLGRDVGLPKAKPRTTAPAPVVGTRTRAHHLVHHHLPHRHHHHEQKPSPPPRRVRKPVEPTPPPTPEHVPPAVPEPAPEPAPEPLAEPAPTPLRNPRRPPHPCPATVARSSRRTDTAIVRRRLWPHPANTRWS